MELTDKQKLFADEYLIDLNATTSFRIIRVNYIARTNHHISPRDMIDVKWNFARKQ